MYLEVSFFKYEVHGVGAYLCHCLLRNSHVQVRFELSRNFVVMFVQCLLENYVSYMSTIIIIVDV